MKVVSLKVKVVKEIWTEEDEGGQVRFATVHVYKSEYKIHIHFLSENYPFRSSSTIKFK